MASNIDRRRVNGPESSQPPRFADLHELQSHLEAKTGNQVAISELEDEVKRSVVVPGLAPVRRGRGPRDLRPIYLQTGLIPQANGSAYLEMGRLKISCAVYGPRQVRGRQYSGQAELNVEVKLAPYALPKRARPGKDVESASLSALVTQALLPSIRLDLLPKATLDIYLTVLEADALDEGCAAASATLASTALADAGVDLYGLVVGSTAALYSKRSTGNSQTQTPVRQPIIYLDPTRDEALAAQSTITLCTMPALGTVTALNQSGVTTWKQTEQALDILHDAAPKIHYVVAQAISDRFKARQAATQGTEAEEVDEDRGSQPFRLQ